MDASMMVVTAPSLSTEQQFRDPLTPRVADSLFDCREHGNRRPGEAMLRRLQRCASI